MRNVLCLPALAVACVCCMAQLPAAGAEYDPLAVAADSGAKPQDLTVVDATRKREIPIRVYLPEGKEAAPVILFSHGLGGSRRAGGYLGKHWSARGYVTVHMQHLGSDESVWRNAALGKRLTTLKSAASLANTEARLRDVPAVLDQLAKWNGEAGHMLYGRLDLSRVGMSGHSYGAQTTQAISGQSLGLFAERFTDRRIRAALAFSPSLPRRGDPKASFAKVTIPWMVMTGTKDNSPIDASVTPESRAAVYPALPETIDKYGLVLYGARHSSFGDTRERRRGGGANPNHHRAILALSTAFWDAHLRDDQAARQWLHGDATRQVLEKQDRWEVHAAEARP